MTCPVTTSRLRMTGQGAVADVRELAPLDLAGGQRQPRVRALQRLHAGQLVRAHDALARRRQGRGRRGTARTRRRPAAPASGIGGGRQPGAAAVRLERPLLSSRAAWRGEMAATMPRWIASSAISRPVHWLIGRADRGGGLAGQRDDPADLLGADAARGRRGGARPPAARPRQLGAAAAARAPASGPPQARRVRARRPSAGRSASCSRRPPPPGRSAPAARVAARCRAAAPAPPTARRSAALNATGGGFGPRIAASSPTPAALLRSRRPVYHRLTHAALY